MLRLGYFTIFYWLCWTATYKLYKRSLQYTSHQENYIFVRNSFYPTFYHCQDSSKATYYNFSHYIQITLFFLLIHVYFFVLINKYVFASHYFFNTYLKVVVHVWDCYRIFEECFKAHTYSFSKGKQLPTNIFFLSHYKVESR